MIPKLENCHPPVRNDSRSTGKPSVRNPRANARNSNRGAGNGNSLGGGPGAEGFEFSVMSAVPLKQPLKQGIPAKFGDMVATWSSPLAAPHVVLNAGTSSDHGPVRYSPIFGNELKSAASESNVKRP